MKFEKVADGSWVRPMDFSAEDGHYHVDHNEDKELDMAYVELSKPPLHTNNSHTDVPTFDDETCLISQFEQLHLRIDPFENRVSSDIGELSNQINQMFAQHSKLIALVHSVCPLAPPQV